MDLQILNLYIELAFPILVYVRQIWAPTEKEIKKPLTSIEIEFCRRIAGYINFLTTKKIKKFL
jgi:hypothetical protein